tara:strand:+ start:2182 stop:4599 length:2418 start_codon:yes stop_codon:yes gene_type:complete
MSVIVGRALPDARDGLKPVQRRILFAMHELGLTPDRPFKKCARVVGDVLGKYHPHGDQAVYDALVRLVQEFNCKYPVLEGHGNFGSIDDDPPAAMRYTETRLAKISSESILSEIDFETVEFSPNFDGSQQEPNVLPAQLPFLILNGCTGIAVGMATSIPPHNLNEIVNGLIALIKNPNCSDEKLLELVPGPDFPTGGEILLGTGVKETYLKGKGSIPMRGIAHIEEINPGKGKHKRTAIIITELPYQVSKSGWIEKLAAQVNDGKFNGIADIRDESDRQGMRIVIELRRDTNPEKILKDLYNKTTLQNNYGAILLALVNGQPLQLSLKDLLLNFLEFRELTIIKRTQYSLKKTLNRLEIIEGLIKALKNLKIVINLIEEAKDAIEARSKLMEELSLNEKQADGVLGMPLRKLTALEKNSLKKEEKELNEKKEELDFILQDRKQLMKILSNELKLLKKKFGSERLTKLIKGGDEIMAERTANQRPNKELQRKQALEAINKDGILIMQLNNQIKIISPKVLNKVYIDNNINLDSDVTPPKLIYKVKNMPKLIAITNTGKIGIIQWEFCGKNPGPLNKFLPSGLEGEKILAILTIPLEKDYSLGLLTSDGKFKRLPMKEVLEMSNRATTILKLKENVSLKSAIFCHDEGEVVVATNLGRLIKLKVNSEDLPLMGKLAQGPSIIKLFPEEKIVNAIACRNPEKEDIILITEQSIFIKLKVKDIRLCKRGDLGEVGIYIKDSKNKPINRVIYANKSTEKSIIITTKDNYKQISQEIIEKMGYKKENKNSLLMDTNEIIKKIEPIIEGMQN